MANWGIRVSKPGFDVGTCADYDLVMSSSFNMLKTKSVGTTSGTVAHGLDYIPIYMCCEQVGGGTVGLMGQFKASDPGIDATNFVANGTVRYYLFYQQSI
jgi:hypothetical protein